MTDVEPWLNGLLPQLTRRFPGRIVCFGLQGSRARGEARASSDIDLVLILDCVCLDDLTAYRSLLDTCPRRELACGFTGGREELLRWEASDLFQFYYDTKPLIGSLDLIKPLITPAAVRRAVRLGACNLYHALTHNFLHEQSVDMVNALYKSASFVLRAKCFCEGGEYLPTKRALLERLRGEDLAVMERCLSGATNLTEDTALLLGWASGLIAAYGGE